VKAGKGYIEGRISLSSGRTKIHRRQERGRREAGENPCWSDEM
jgi:hypothetical protein